MQNGQQCGSESIRIDSGNREGCQLFMAPARKFTRQVGAGVDHLQDTVDQRAESSSGWHVGER